MKVFPKALGDHTESPQFPKGVFLYKTDFWVGLTQKT